MTDAAFHIAGALAQLKYIRDPMLGGVVDNIRQRLELALRSVSEPDSTAVADDRRSTQTQIR